MYAFRFQHPKAMRYLWLVVLAPVLVMFLFIWLAWSSASIMIIAVLLTVAICFYFLFTRGKAADEITLDRNSFTSAFFGRVEFDEIKSVSGRSLSMEPPSMRITLHSGRKLTWRITIKGSIYNSVADAETFMRFTSDLSARMDAWTAKYNNQYQQGSHTDEDVPTPAEQLRKVATGNSKAVWAIPIGLAFALIGLFKTCGKEWFGKREPDFAKMAEQSELRYEDNIEAAKAVMQEYLKTQGAYFLYTNDTAARAELLPDIDDSNPTGIHAFQHTTANSELQAFIEHPDSFEIRTVIVACDETISPMRESILNLNDSAAIKLFIRFYDPQQRVVPAGMRRNEVTDSSVLPVFDVFTAIPLYDSLNIRGPVSETFPGMNMMLAQVRHRPSFRIYLTGREKDGISESLFRKVVTELNRQLHAVKADTSGFVIRAYNR